MSDIVSSVEELEKLYGVPGDASLVKEASWITPHYRAYIEASPFVSLATVGPEGIDCSPRGDKPGFVRIHDDKTLMLPDRRGNNRIDSLDRKSTRLNSSHTEIYTLSLHDALPIWHRLLAARRQTRLRAHPRRQDADAARPARQQSHRFARSEEHTSELQSHRDLHSFPTRRSSDLASTARRAATNPASCASTTTRR